jgi:hypothetical protein
VQSEGVTRALVVSSLSSLAISFFLLAPLLALTATFLRLVILPRFLPLLAVLPLVGEYIVDDVSRALGGGAAGGSAEL